MTLAEYLTQPHRRSHHETPLRVLHGTRNPDDTITGSTSASGDGQVVQTRGVDVIRVRITGASGWDGTIHFEGTMDGTTWEALNAVPLSSGTPGSTATANGTYRVSVYGLSAFRARMSGRTTGNVIVLARGVVTGYASTLLLSPSETHLGEVGGRTVVVNTEFTRPANTTAYAAKASVSNSTSAPTILTFANAARIAAGSGYVVSARLNTNQSTNIAEFRLHLYTSTQTATNDGAAFPVLYANRAARIGFIDFPACQTSGAGSDMAYATNAEIRLPFKLPSGTSLFGRLETLSAFTPASGQQFFIELGVEQN